MDELVTPAELTAHDEDRLKAEGLQDQPNDEELRAIRLAGMGDGELRMRQQLGRVCLRVLRKAARDGEEVKPEVKVQYQEQLWQITDEIRRRRRQAREAEGVPKPPTMLMRMKTARLGARTKRDGG